MFDKPVAQFMVGIFLLLCATDVLLISSPKENRSSET